jgi:hypothetical protein
MPAVADLRASSTSVAALKEMFSKRPRSTTVIPGVSKPMRKATAGRPAWAEYSGFDDDDDDDGDGAYQPSDLDTEERESQEFIKAAKDSIQTLAALSESIQPDMDVREFDEEKFSSNVKEFMESGKRTVRYAKRKLQQSVRHPWRTHWHNLEPPAAS